MHWPIKPDSHHLGDTAGEMMRAMLYEAAPLLRLSAWLPRRKIAKPRYRRHQHKSRPDTGGTVSGLAPFTCLHS
jgi:hypothetical protein